MDRTKTKDNFAKWLNNILYSSREKVQFIVRITSVIISLLALGLLLYIYGFEPSASTLHFLLSLFDIIFFLFVITYLTRLLYAFRRGEFLKSTKFEGILMIIIVLNGLFNILFKNFILINLFQYLGLQNYHAFYLGIISVFLIIILIYEFARLSTNLGEIKVKPDRIFILSFLLLFLIGTGLLMMPAMTTTPGSMPFIDAFFTSISAVCVTGLIVVDTATFFTFKGQFIIMVLIQMGGLGILTFATFFASFLKGGMGIKHKSMVPDYLDTETLESARNLIKQIILMTFLIEGIAFILIFFSWGPEVQFNSLYEKIFDSLFQSISAFCNAGFSTFTNSLYEAPIRYAYTLHLVMAFTIILGSIGFPTLQDIFSPQKIKERIKYPWKEWKIGSKISIHSAIFLLLFGTIALYLLEANNTLGHLNFFEGLIKSFFQSASARTAGFNTMDISQLQIPTLIIIIFLMFIGGGSGGTSGGIKTSTFYVLIVSAIATIKGRLRIEIGHRYIPSEIMFKALSIFFFAASFNLIAIFVLSLTEPHLNIMDVVFEQVSAFGTVGYSTGITSQLSEAGKLIITLSMFLGRIGTLTFALALSRRVSTRSYKYPSSYIMVG